MKKRWYPALFFIFLLLAVSLACSTSGTEKSTPTEETKASGGSLGIIQSVTMAKDASETNFIPISPTINFINPEIMHAVVTLKDAPANTRVRVDWMTDKAGNSKPNFQMGTYELSTEGSRNIDFTFKPDTQLPEGTYYVNVFLNGAFFLRVNFTVAAG